MGILAKAYDRIARQGMGRALRHRHFRTFMLTDIVSNIGVWIYRVGGGWLTWDLTHSGFWLGVFSLAQALPGMVLLPLSGAVADRVDRLRIIRTTQSIGMVLAGTLTLLTFSGLINVYLLCLFAFLLGINHSFTLPVRMTLPPVLVPPEDLTPAIGLTAAFYSSSRFIGPALGGVIIALWGVGFSFLANLFGFAIFFTGLMSVRLLKDERSGMERAGIIAEVAEGVRYAFTHACIGPLLALVIVVSVVTRPFIDLFPGFAEAIFHQGPEGLGTLLSATGIGGIAASFWVANYTGKTGLLKIILIGMSSTALLLLVYASTDFFPLAVLLVAGLGFSLSMWQAFSQVLIQGSVEGKVRARVMSLYALTYRAGPAVGALIMGAASGYFGLQLPVAVGAVICLVALLILAPRRHRLAAAFEAIGQGRA